MAKMKPGQVPAKRAYQMADSLQKRADFDLQWAKGVGKVANEEKNPSIKSVLLKNSAKSYNDFMHNYEKSNRYRTNADNAVNKAKATAGRDMPLPSSEGIIGKIKNFFD